jgi:hypothetical protein
VEDRFNRFISWLAENTAYSIAKQKIRIFISARNIIYTCTYINLIGLSDVNFGNHSQNFEFKRLIALEKIKITVISIILERSQKCVINKIEVKILGKNQNGTT